MCSTIIAQVLNDLESGAFPQPLMFGYSECAGGQWPPTRESLPLSIFGSLIPAIQICPSSLKIECPTPIVMSMVTPPNLKITFYANVNNEQVIIEPSPPATPILDRVQEPGQTAVYSSTYSAQGHLSNIITTTPLKWYSSKCNGEPNNCNSESDNCMIPVGSEFFTVDADPNKSKMLQSMISCNSPLWPSFQGINAEDFVIQDSDPNYVPCRTYVEGSPQPTYTGQDYCLQFGISSIEATAYASVWFVHDQFHNCGAPAYSSVPSFFQACGVVGTRAEGENSAIPKDTGNNCGPNLCGACTILDDNPLPCMASEGKVPGTLTLINGSVQSMQIDFVDNDKNVINWPQLQALWCYSGVSFAGIPIDKYKQGTNFCDNIMRQVCSNTADLTLNPKLAQQCQCIIEEKQLQAQFAGIDLPSQCFSTVCNLPNASSYKTKEQIVGCSARLCQQVLSVNGSAMLAQGFQEVVCNGEIYDIAAVSNAGDVPLVSQVQEPYGGFVLGPTFYVSIAVFLMLMVLVAVYVVQTIRTNRRMKQIKQEQFEENFIENHVVS